MNPLLDIIYFDEKVFQNDFKIYQLENKFDWTNLVNVDFLELIL